jgi:hypothetical protein
VEEEKPSDEERPNWDRQVSLPCYFLLKRMTERPRIFPMKG